jgi:hypothetical protein
LKKANNLSDVADVATARTNLSVDSSAEVTAKIDAAKLALGTNYSVADIAARDALTGLTVGDNVFVLDDGDTKWAIYKVTAIGTIVFEKIMDEDVYLNAQSASAIKSTYESNSDTNAFNDAYKAMLDLTEVLAEEPTVTNNSADVTLANTPSLIKGVYLNGLRTKYYTLATATITFDANLHTNDEVYVDYVY